MGKLVVTLVLIEFIDWLKVVCKERYGPNNIRVDYVMNFLDGLKDDVHNFVNIADMKAPKYDPNT